MGILEFKNWEEVGEYFDSDDVLNKTNWKILVDGVEHHGYPEFLHGINWIEVGEPDPSTEKLAKILSEEIRKEINKEIIGHVTPGATNVE